MFGHSRPFSLLLVRKNTKKHDFNGDLALLYDKWMKEINARIKKVDTHSTGFSTSLF